MPTYSMNVCARDGLILQTNSVSVKDAESALIEANRLFCRLASRSSDILDLQGRIDVTDDEGRTVARLIMTESIAAMR
jgi:hypothetical protein